MLYESILTRDEINRYSRQIILKEIGAEGQVKIRDAKVLVVGLGGLGSPVAIYLTGSGIKTLGILDYDEVELHNLQRQVMHMESYVGKKKTESATNFLQSFNSSINIKVHNDFLDENKLEKIIQNYDIILDCTDNIKTRYVINDITKINNKVFIAASVLTWEGQVFVFTKESPCYRCMFPVMKTESVNCDEAGVISSACGVIGSIQATETLKSILGLSKPELITFNTLTGEYSRFDIDTKKKCVVCTSKSLIDQKNPDSQAAPRMIQLDKEYKISWEDYFKNVKDHTLIDIRSKLIFDICHIKNSINIPTEEIKANPKIVEKHKSPVLICTKGNTARKLCAALKADKIKCKVIEGGLVRFKSDIDDTFPLLNE